LQPFGSPPEPPACRGNCQTIVPRTRAVVNGRTEEAAERKFVEDTLIRGEAVELDEKGKLPPDATHEIVEGHEGEPPTLKRRRFKAF
jgi:hypothetical protein